jgi:hypothetical protein
MYMLPRCPFALKLKQVVSGDKHDVDVTGHTPGPIRGLYVHALAAVLSYLKPMPVCLHSLGAVLVSRSSAQLS